MSSFTSKFSKKRKSDYKELYEIELNNRKMYEKRYKEIKEENIKLQKETGIADLRKQLNKVSDENCVLKEENAKLKLELEDVKGFLLQETQAKEELKKQRTKLKREITILKKQFDKK